MPTPLDHVRLILSGAIGPEQMAWVRDALARTIMADAYTVAEVGLEGIAGLPIGWRSGEAKRIRYAAIRAIAAGSFPLESGSALSEAILTAWGQYMRQQGPTDRERDRMPEDYYGKIYQHLWIILKHGAKLSDSTIQRAMRSEDVN